jgi:Na+-driven multidrug efflux pump
MQHLAIALGGMILQSTINAEGSIFVAGFTATNKLYGLLEGSAISIGIAMATFLAQNYGAEQYARVRRGVFEGGLLAILAAAVVFCIVLPLGRPLLSLFLDTAEVGAGAAMEIAYRYLCLMLFHLPILYLIHVFRNALQSIGVAVWSLVSGGAEFCARVGLAKLVTPRLGVDVLYYIEPIAWLAALLVVIPPYFYYQKKRLRVE